MAKTTMIAALLLLCALAPHVIALIELCPGVSVDETGLVAVGDAFERCLSTMTHDELSIPAGIYSINQTITGSNSSSEQPTLQTRGIKAGTCQIGEGFPCATLRAHTSLAHPIIDAKFLELKWIIVDGNKASRRHLASSCSHGADRTAGVSVRLSATSGAEFRGNAFVNAVCGAAVITSGSGILFQENMFGGNGDFNNATHAYADGLTMGVSEGSRLTRNLFVDNTRSGVSLGGGAAIQVDANIFIQKTSHAFAALTLDTLHGPHASEFWGARVTGNTIECGNGLCLFGIQLGSVPYVVSGKTAPIIGGSVSNNTIRGAVVNVNVNDATNWQLFENIYSHNTGKFHACTGASVPLNISPVSEVDRHGESTPEAGRASYVGCVPAI